MRYTYPPPRAESRPTLPDLTREACALFVVGMFSGALSAVLVYFVWFALMGEVARYGPSGAMLFAVVLSLVVALRHWWKNQ